MHFYSKEELEYLREIAPEKSNKEMAELFNKKFNTDINYKSLASTRKRYGIATGRTGYFPKGHISHNKGKKKYWKGGEETQFQKGNKPHNWVPIGSERITKDGYIQIKIQEGKFQHNWKGKHILVWEEHNGPVPINHNVVFGDGDKRNFNIENLILVTKSQQLYLNRYNLIKDDADITKLGITLADIDKKLNERKKKIS